MHCATSPKLEELFSKSHNFDQCNERKFDSTQSESAISDQLISKIVLMKRHMTFLKNQIEKERNLLNTEKLALHYSNSKQDKDINPTNLPNYAVHTSAPFLNQTAPKLEPLADRLDERLPLTMPTKQHLREIEQNCDMELVKLERYIKHINEMKLHWKYLWSQHKSINELGDHQPAHHMERLRSVYEGVPSDECMQDGIDSNVTLDMDTEPTF